MFFGLNNSNTFCVLCSWPAFIPLTAYNIEPNKAKFNEPPEMSTREILAGVRLLIYWSDFNAIVYTMRGIEVALAEKKAFKIIEI